MKKTITIIIISIFIACSQESTEPNGKMYSVSGTIQNEIGPVAKAVVSIDEALNWTSETDIDGKFLIEDVASGEHQLNIYSQLTDGSFIEQENKLVVSTDIVLDDLKLPKPIYMIAPLHISATNIELLWKKTDANNFREYKLFRHTTSGLDEKTGTLIHVATSNNDTSFIDENLIPSETYYYRIYVMNEFGRLGGSNIVVAKTKEINLITNGGFEDGPIGFLETWDKIWNAYEYTGIRITDSIAKSGIYSLHLNVPAGETIHETFIAQTLEKDYVKYGEKYTISFKAKHDSFDDENASNGLFLSLKWCDGNYYLGEDDISFISLPEVGNNDWKDYSFETEIFESASKYLRFGLIVLRHGGGIPQRAYNVWLDDFKMVKNNN